MVVVTCFGPGGWEKYGQKFVEKYIEHKWPLPLKIYYHDQDYPSSPPLIEGIEYLQLNDVDLTEFKERNRERIEKTLGKDYRYDVGKFSHKVFAILSAAEKGPEKLLWLDMDTFATGPFPELEEVLKSSGLECDIAYLGRNCVPYAETSFIYFNLLSEKARCFIRDWVWNYVSDEVFNHKEWHDGWLFSRVLNLHVQNGLVARNLTPNVKDLDAFSQGPLGKCAVHLKGNRKDNAPILIQPKSAVAAPELLNNVIVNSKLEEWLEPCERHEGSAVLLGSGPYLDQYLEGIKYTIEMKNEGIGGKDTVFCVKHALPKLKQWGIVPDFCVVLEARPLSGVSTHGVMRQDLYAAAHPNTIFLVASMTDPAVVEFLRARGSRIIGWHTTSQEFTDAVKMGTIPKDSVSIGGGTCAIMRAVGVAHTMGFRDMHIYGVDACYGSRALPMTEHLRTDDKGRKWWIPMTLQTHTEGGTLKTFEKDGVIYVEPDSAEQFYWVSGEMGALVQDVQRLAAERSPDFRVALHSPGLAGDVWREYSPPRFATYEGRYAHNRLRGS